MATAAIMGVLGAILLGPAGMVLDRGSWQSRAPRAAIALWQSIGLAGGLCIIGAGLALAVARFHAGFLGGLRDLVQDLSGRHPLSGITISGALGLTLAVDVALILASGLALTVLRTIRIRSRHRRLLDLVSLASEQAPGTVILDHPHPAAYCLPGLRSRVVISAGTLHLLDPSELAAVVAHERGHVRERHGLVMLPFASLADLFGWIPYSRRAAVAVSALVELAADDYAARRHDPRVLASALVHLATSDHAPSCAFGGGGPSVAARVQRLSSDHRTSRSVATAAMATAAAMVCIPVGGLLIA